MLFPRGKMRPSDDDGGVLKLLDVLSKLFLGFHFREIDDDEGHLFMQKLVFVWLELIYFLRYLRMSLRDFRDVLESRLEGIHFLISNTVAIFNITGFISYRSGSSRERPKIYIPL